MVRSPIILASRECSSMSSDIQSKPLAAPACSVLVFVIDPNGDSPSERITKNAAAAVPT